MIPLLNLQNALGVYDSSLCLQFLACAAVQVTVKGINSGVCTGPLTSRGARISGPDCEGQTGQRELRAGCGATGCGATRSGRGAENRPEQALWQRATSKSGGQERFHVSTHRPLLS